MRLYSVIYDAINDVEDALKGLAPKKYTEVKYGVAEVRKIFKITNEFQQHTLPGLTTSNTLTSWKA